MCWKPEIAISLRRIKTVRWICARSQSRLLFALSAALRGVKERFDYLSRQVGKSFASKQAFYCKLQVGKNSVYNTKIITDECINAARQTVLEKQDFYSVEPLIPCAVSVLFYILRRVTLYKAIPIKLKWSSQLILDLFSAIEKSIKWLKLRGMYKIMKFIFLFLNKYELITSLDKTLACSCLVFYSLIYLFSKIIFLLTLVSVLSHSLFISLFFYFHFSH